ncbi:hypothetical protein [Pseudopontixanthobacter vadosimaris]|uniref:hypothetical protein n=1 Tax=Pseudopontixanthobacter vadosimaris TaxID=2726450 RepID=UPI001473308A|nr:hypothetical protein [Pseudopontixanthobacter vadosimaris]
MSITETRNWAIKQISQLDLLCPGIAGHFLRSSHERTQVLSAYLAFRETADLNADETYELLHATHDRILSLALSEVPQGFRSALSRATKRSHPRAFYHQLHAILSSAEPTERRAFSYLTDLDLDLLSRWTVTPPAMRRWDFVGIFDDVEEIEEFFSAIEVLSSSGICKTVVTERFSSIQSRKALAQAFNDLLSQINFRGFPIAGNVFISPVRSVAELKRLARIFRNCSASYTYEVLDGSSLFYIINELEPRGMVRLEKEQGSWVIADMVGRSNQPLPETIVADVARYFEAAGVSRSSLCRPSRWAGVRKFCRTNP